MSRQNKLITALLSIVLCFSMFTFTAYAVGENESGGGDVPASEAPVDPVTPEPEPEPEPFVASRESSASLVSAKLTREEETFVDETVSPSGGKLVSIPSFDVDALHGENNDDDRIIGLTKEDMKNATKKRSSRF